MRKTIEYFSPYKFYEMYILQKKWCMHMQEIPGYLVTWLLGGDVGVNLFKVLPGGRSAANGSSSRVNTEKKI